MTVPCRRAEGPEGETDALNQGAVVASQGPALLSLSTRGRSLTPDALLCNSYSFLGFFCDLAGSHVGSPSAGLGSFFGICQGAQWHTVPGKC